MHLEKSFKTITPNQIDHWMNSVPKQGRLFKYKCYINKTTEYIVEHLHLSKEWYLNIEFKIKFNSIPIVLLALIWKCIYILYVNTTLKSKTNKKNTNIYSFIAYVCDFAKGQNQCLHINSAVHWFTTFIICASNNITNINRSKFKIFE